MELLKKLYQISSPSGQERAMQKFIIDYCKKLQDVVAVKDKTGNIYITKGEDKTYPCIVAHIDEVHPKNNNKEIVIHNNVLLGLDRKAMKQTGIGADDKNGIWVALNLLTTQKVLKCAFFVGEEVGCIGSEKANMDFFANTRFVLQCDRRNAADFINNASNVELCDKDFYDRCHASKFGYKPTNGLQTDVVTLKKKGLKVCAANLSCGYYNPHQEAEMTRFDELQNCLALCEHIITTVTEVQTHIYTPRTSATNTFLHDFDDYGYFLHSKHHSEWYEQNEQLKQVAETDIIDDYMRLLELYPDNQVRLYLKRKYQFLNNAPFIDQCIDAQCPNDLLF